MKFYFENSRTQTDETYLFNDNIFWGIVFQCYNNSSNKSQIRKG